MHRTHKIRLYPNNRQTTYLSRCCGTARFAYNWGLARWKELYEAHKFDPDTAPQPNHFMLNKELNAIKREKFPWITEVSKDASEQAIHNLGDAFDNFFRKTAKFPKFKRKGSHDSFTFRYVRISSDGNMVKIPGLTRFIGGRMSFAWIRMAEKFRYGKAKIIFATVSRTADKWFIAITCELEDVQNEKKLSSKEKVVGIDLGVGEYVTSDGEFYSVPRSYRHAMRRLRRAQQSFDRKKKGSRNRQRQKMRVARIYAHVANIHKDWLHKFSSDITRRYGTVVLESLNVKGMEKNRSLAISIFDAGFGEFRRQIEYKSKVHGCEVLFADRWYPSSKTCSRCGRVKTKLSLGERTYRCDGCGFVCHRDLNAAMNLRNLAASSAVSACGEFSASTPVRRLSACSLDEAGRKHHLKAAG